MVSSKACYFPGGTILICVHVNSSSPSGHRAAHLMTVEEHLSTFKKVGFINPREICPAADLSLMGAESPKKNMLKKSQCEPGQWQIVG